MRLIRRLPRAAGTVCVALASFAALAPAQAAPPVFGSFGNAVWGGTDDALCASPEGSFNFLNGPTCFFSRSSIASGSSSDGASGSSGSATARLDQGFVSVQVSGNGLGSYAHALVWDTLTFSGAAPGAVATLTMTGSASLSGDARIDAAALLVDPSVSGPIGTPPSILEGNFNDPVTAGAYSVSHQFGIANGVPMLLEIAVSASDGNSFSPGSAFIEDPFNLQLPDGVTFTAASLTAAPEPATLMVLATALAGLGAMRRRRG